jgi:hypothetical protein
VQLSDQQVIDIFERLGGIEAKLDALARPGAVCQVHSSRLDDIVKRMDLQEKKIDDHGAVLGKHGLISATLGAIGAVLVLVVKYVMIGRAS